MAEPSSTADLRTGPKEPRSTTLTVEEEAVVVAERRITRWEHEVAMETMQARLDRSPTAMRLRRQTIEHVFGTLKDWVGRRHFKMLRLENVGTEIGLHIIAYNTKRAIALLGGPELMAAMQA